jgi:dTMP kinase
MVASDKIVPYKSSNDSLFISMEGIEGSGKSTQIKSIAKFLEDNGYQVLTLREPGGTKFGEGLRSAILGSEHSLHPLAEAYLFAASRAQLLNEKILPFLKSTKSAVILDRYLDSSIAYQGMARGLGAETIIDIHRYSPLNIAPNMTFYLKIDLETSMKRQDARGNSKDYFEKESKDFYKDLISGYDLCAQLFPKRVRVIDAKKSVAEVADLLLAELKRSL